MQSHSKTILVIDDDYRELDIMDCILNEAGYRVLVAEDGETGVQRAFFAQPDLILLDVMMPGMSGHKAAQLLRSNPRTKDIPIFFKSCNYSAQSIVEGFVIGVDDYLKKPVNHAQLLHKIRIRFASDRLQHLKDIDSSAHALP